MKSQLTLRSRIRGALLGLAVGDAVGTTLEFSPRGSFEPIKDMVGGGPFRLEPGQWTDDTSLALCLARSLVDCRGFDATDQMEKYLRWEREGYLSSTGECFDIGITTSRALAEFAARNEPFAGPTEAEAGGNGSLMRLSPVPICFRSDPQEAIRLAGESSRTTHGAAEPVDACRLFAAMLLRALEGEDKETILRRHGAGDFGAPLAAAIAQLADGQYRAKEESGIRGGGYVVEALEAALWCFDRTDSFEDAVLRAANLGDDADTTAAITGQIAGAFYAEEGIPLRWRERLAMGLQIRRLADALSFAWPPRKAPWARSYWANPAGLIGGAYPGHEDADEADRIVQSIVEAGATLFVNLMEADEAPARGRFAPYEERVRQAGEARGLEVECLRFPVVDLSVPSRQEMQSIQARIDEEIARGGCVYVHCMGGRGRTGTVVGIHLVRYGQAERDDFHRVIAERRALDEGGGLSPETGEQRGFVLRYLDDEET